MGLKKWNNLLHLGDFTIRSPCKLCGCPKQFNIIDYHITFETTTCLK